MMEVLKNAKPCPMCGSNYIVSETTSDEFGCTVYIQCGDCGLKGHKGFYKTVDEDTGFARTLAYWNERYVC